MYVMKYNRENDVNVDIYTCILGNLLPFSFSMDGYIFGEGFIFFSRPSTFVDLFGTAGSSSHLP